MSNSQAKVRLYCESGYIHLIINGYEVKLVSNYSTKCIILLIAYCLRDTQGNQVFTGRQISEALGYSPTWGHGKWTYLNTLNFDLKLFFKAAEHLDKTICGLVKTYVLSYPLHSPSELYEGFKILHPGLGLSFYQFNRYVSGVDTRLVLRLMRKQLQQGALSVQASHCLSLMVTELRYHSKPGAKYVRDLATLSKVAPCPEIKSYTDGTGNALYMLLALLYQSGVSQDDLSRYFAISKGSVHNYIYRFALPLRQWLLQNIESWSGEICVDEKWIKVAGQWQYVLTGVDAATGIPLLSKRFRCIDTVAWVAFLKEFQTIYGSPKLITSDGSGAIAKAICLVFKGKVRHQLCWFHKLKNLYKHIYGNIKDKALGKRAIRLALNSFYNKYGSSRKKAARTLADIDCSRLRKYVLKSILKPWRQLTFCLTSNAAERYNRKIQKPLLPDMDSKMKPVQIY